MRRILARHCKGLVTYQLIVPVTIDVYAEGPIDLEEMKWSLSQNCLVSMGKLGTYKGPGASVVLPLVDSTKLRKMMRDS
jgi:hypothetical protein